ncbi:MAG: T9SS type A sorting domain-containing protein [Ignavibacteria bacterium]|nr:T9SS type A sorting domain-containing protein [Ignavibacteria bacterium]
MKILMILFPVLLSVQLFAQVPDPAFNPMTAPGAKGIHWNNHILHWKNSMGTVYNEVYFSNDSIKVANKDTTVRVRNGLPSTIHTSYPLNSYGQLYISTKYYWRVVEYNAFGNSISDLWWFQARGGTWVEYSWDFDYGLENWQTVGPLGISNWYWSNTTHTGSTPGEIVFRWDPVFIGNSYIMSPEIHIAAGVNLYLTFNYYEDWWADTAVVGCGITTNNGITWSSIWELRATGNVGPDNVNVNLETTGDFRLGYYYFGNSNNIDFFYIDNVQFDYILSPPSPPTFLEAIHSDSVKKVKLNWDNGTGFACQMTSYILQRKIGLPSSANQYSTIAITDINTHSFEDFNVELNQIYTYRIRLYCMPGISPFGNEATAYVPVSVPIELVSFNANGFEEGVSLNWITATEMNNSGFEIQRLKDLKIERLEGWENIGFVNGHGTTTEPQTYSYTDEKVSAGKYQYRLKQIDFDGTFEYSNTIEAEINPPAKFSLEQNYPNPFNPVTTIRYSIPNVTLSGVEGSRVQLKVFDVLGNEVATLVNEYKPAGNYEVEFEASKFSSGIYYYQLKAGEFIQTKKMIILK